MNSLKVAVVLSAVDRLTAPLRQSQQALRGLADAARATAPVQQAAAGLDQVADVAKALSAPMHAAAGALDAVGKAALAAGTVARFGQSVGEVATQAAKYRQVAQLAASVRDVEGAVRPADVATAGLLTRLRDLADSGAERATRALGGAAKAMGARFKAADTALEQYEATAKRAGQLRGVSLGAGVVAAGALAPVAKVVSAYAQVENARTRLQMAFATAKGTDPAFAAVVKEADRLGALLPGENADFYRMATAMKEASLAGNVLSKSALNAAASYRLLVTPDADPAEAGRQMASLGQSFSIAQGQFAGFVDALQKAHFAFGLDPTDMQYSAEYLAGTFHSLKIGGLDAAQGVLAFAGTMSQAGIRGQKLGTGLREILSRIPDLDRKLKPGKELTKTLEGAGVALQFFDKHGQFLGFENLMGQLEKLNRFNPKTKLSVMEQLFGREAETIGVLMAEQGAVGYRHAIATLAERADLKELMAMILATQTAGWDAFTGSMANAFAKMGEALKPFTGPALQALEDFANGLQAFSEQHPVVIQAAAALAVVAGSIAAVVAAVAGIGGALLAVQVGLGAFAAFTGVTLGPVLAILAAVAAAVVAVVWAFNHWDEIVAFVSGLWDRVADVIAGFILWLENVDWLNVGSTVARVLALGIFALPTLLAPLVDRVTDALLAMPWLEAGAKIAAKMALGFLMLPELIGQKLGELPFKVAAAMDRRRVAPLAASGAMLAAMQGVPHLALAAAGRAAVPAALPSGLTSTLFRLPASADMAALIAAGSNGQGLAGVGLAPGAQAAAGGRGGAPVVLQYSPVLHLAAGTPADVRAQIEASMRQQQAELARLVEDVIRTREERHARLSFRK